jgi:hypothetical protein
VCSGVLSTAVLLVYYAGLSSGTKGLVEAYHTILLLATFATLVPYAFCAMAEQFLYVLDGDRFSGRRLGGAGLIASLDFAFLTILGPGAQTELYGFTYLLPGASRSTPGRAGARRHRTTGRPARPSPRRAPRRPSPRRTKPKPDSTLALL